MEQDTTRVAAGYRLDDGSAAVGLLFEEDRVVQRAAVELFTVDVLPELDIVDVVERDFEPIDAGWCGRTGCRELR